MSKSKGGGWITVNLEDEEIKYSYERHNPVVLKGTPWLYCRYCGLLYLNNPITKWCIKMGCNSSYHLQYKMMVKKLTGKGGTKHWERKT